MIDAIQNRAGRNSRNQLSLELQEGGAYYIVSPVSCEIELRPLGEDI
jgi:hypothetical protein